ncbi:MAG: ABC transporter ATP-binding protein [Trueperaceae bacterium]
MTNAPNSTSAVSTSVAGRSVTDLPGTSPVALLDVADVTVRLGGVSIVEDVTFQVTPGDLVLLTGANGAGKSTLLRALVGLLPASGDIAIAGRPAASLDARRTFVFAPDEPALYEDLTLAEHAHFTALLYAKPEAEQRSLAWLGRFDLEGRTGEFPGTHSRGMRQKLALALALGLEMPLTLLDEPFNGLDLEAQQLLADGLAARARAGGAVLLTGHQPELAGALGATVLALRDGRMARA